MSRRRSLGLTDEQLNARARASRQYNHDYKAELEACIKQTDFLLKKSVRGYLLPRRRSTGRTEAVEDIEFPHVKFNLTRQRTHRGTAAVQGSIRDAHKTTRPTPESFDLESPLKTQDVGKPEPVKQQRKVGIAEGLKATQPHEETIEEIFSSEVAVPAKPTRYLITDDIGSFRKNHEEETRSYSEQSSDDFHFVFPEPVSSSSCRSLAGFMYPRITKMPSYSESDSEDMPSQEVDLGLVLKSAQRLASSSSDPELSIPLAPDRDVGSDAPETRPNKLKAVRSVLFKTFNTSDEEKDLMTGNLFGESSTSSESFTDSLSSRIKKSLSESRSEPKFPRLIQSSSFDTVDEDMKD